MDRCSIHQAGCEAASTSEVEVSHYACVRSRPQKWSALLCAPKKEMEAGSGYALRRTCRQEKSSCSTKPL